MPVENRQHQSFYGLTSGHYLLGMRHDEGIDEPGDVEFAQHTQDQR